MSSVQVSSQSSRCLMQTSLTDGTCGWSPATGALSSSSQLAPTGSNGSSALDKLAKTIRVKFSLKYDTAWGEGVKIIGASRALGKWSVAEAPELKWNNDRWSVTLELPHGIIEYKYVIINYETKQPVHWQSGGNAVLGLEPEEAGTVEVEDNWPNAPGASVKSGDGSVLTREDKLRKWGKHMLNYYDQSQSARAELQVKAVENTVMKSDLAQTKMELSLKKRETDEMSMKISELQQDCLRLKMDLTATQMEMNNTLAEALTMLQEEIDRDAEEEEEDGEYE
eukprot:gene22791-29957_t